MQYTRLPRDARAPPVRRAAVDAVVVRESDSPLSTFASGMPADRIEEQFLGPAPVGQREPDGSDVTTTVARAYRPGLPTTSADADRFCIAA